MSTEADQALLALLGELARVGYRFTPPTPETHRRVIARRERAETLRDIFGWSLPFAREVVAEPLWRLLDRAGMIGRHADGFFKSKVRVASIEDALFLHSAFPTEAEDSVFFGPDSYRFVDFVELEMAGRDLPAELVDIGTGSGVGGVMAALGKAGVRAVLTDINPAALRLAAINARHNGVEAVIRSGSGVEPVDGPIALAISNPPFLKDRSGRAYRDGGGMLGAQLSLDWAVATAAKLGPGGRMLLYTASAIVAGNDPLREALAAALQRSGCRLRYKEIDPDIFGEQLDEPGYEEVERIAAVGVVIERE